MRAVNGKNLLDISKQMYSKQLQSAQDDTKKEAVHSDTWHEEKKKHHVKPSRTNTALQDTMSNSECVWLCIYLYSTEFQSCVA